MSVKGVGGPQCALIDGYFISVYADQRGRMVRKGWQASAAFLNGVECHFSREHYDSVLY